MKPASSSRSTASSPIEIRRSARTWASACRWAAGAAKKGSLLSSTAATMPDSVDKPVAIRVVGKMAAASAEPFSARSPMMPVGSRARPLVLMARKSTIALVAVPFSALSVSSSFMAFKPKGVAALPSPRALAAMFMTIAPIAGWLGGTSGKSRTSTGRIRRAMKARPPASSTIFIRPRKRAM